MTENNEICEKCGKTKEEHPFRILNGYNEIWVECKKFKPKNNHTQEKSCKNATGRKMVSPVPEGTFEKEMKTKTPSDFQRGCKKAKEDFMNKIDEPFDNITHTLNDWAVKNGFPDLSVVFKKIGEQREELKKEIWK